MLMPPNIAEAIADLFAAAGGIYGIILSRNILKRPIPPPGKPNWYRWGHFMFWGGSFVALGSIVQAVVDIFK